MGYMNKSKTDDWTTPIDLYDKLDKEFNFNFDPVIGNFNEKVR